MSEETRLQLKRSQAPLKALKNGFHPSQIEYPRNSPVIVRLAGGEEYGSTCVGCPDTPCFSLTRDKFTVAMIDGFSSAVHGEVCATEAIVISSETGVPEIDSDHCSFCGICVDRCPVGAIYIDEDRGAIVSTGDSELFENVAGGDARQYEETLEKFKNAIRVGPYVNESDSFIQKVGERVAELCIELDGDVSGVLVRNLLISIGFSAATRRKGNTHLRMDLLFEKGSEIQGLAEIEFSDSQTLDMSRDILDSVAVASSRYGVDKTDLFLAGIFLTFPNRRTDYWEILRDINTVLRLKVGTISLMSLMLLVWNRSELDRQTLECFYTDPSAESYLDEVLVKLIGRELNLSASSSSFLEVIK